MDLWEESEESLIMSLSEFLQNREFPEDSLKKIEEEKVDCSTIPLMSEEELKLFFPKHGDRVAVLNFCKKNNASKKSSLIEKLKVKLNRKTSKKDNTYIKRNVPKRSLKSTRVIEIGWLCMSKNDQSFRQVRTKAGGGTRKLSVPKDCSCKDVLVAAKKLFFPEGVSTKGALTEFEIKLLDYKSHECNLDLTIQEMYDISALTVLRFYIGTIYKNIPLNEDDEGSYIPQTITAPSENGDYEESYIPQTITAPSENGDYEESYIPQTITAPSENGDYEESYIPQTITAPSESLEDPGPVFNLLDPKDDMKISRNNMNVNSYLDDFVQEVTATQDNFDHQHFFTVYESNNDNIEEKLLIIHRANIFEDLLKAFEQNFFDTGHFKLEIILPTGERELAEDFGGVWRDILSEFWNTFYEKCTVGTHLKVPYIRHDFGELQWRAIAKIFVKGFKMEKYVPIKLSPVFLKTCLNIDVIDEILLNDFFSYICDSDNTVLKQALTNFEDIDQDELIEIISTYDAKWSPNKNNFPKLIRDIAHKELIQKPSFVVKCFQKEWGEKLILGNEFFELFELLKPSVKNCLSKIKLDSSNMKSEEEKIFNFLKKYIKECDDKIREAFFRFCTGSNLPINTITVTFTETTGLNRLPIAHTCSSILQLSTTYENFVTFRMEINSVLSSNIWIMDMV